MNHMLGPAISGWQETVIKAFGLKVNYLCPYSQNFLCLL